MDEGTGRLVAGHGRSEALVRLKAGKEEPPSNIEVRSDGEWMVPVIRGNRFATEQEAEAYLIADNRLVQIGGWDEQALAEIFKQFDTPDTLAQFIDGIGYDAREVDRILQNSEIGEAPIIRGPTPESLAENYFENEVRRIIIYLQGDAYSKCVEQLDAIVQKFQLQNHTDAFLWLLGRYTSEE